MEEALVTATVNELYEHLLNVGTLTVEAASHSDAEKLVAHLSTYKSRTYKLLRSLGGDEADFDKQLSSTFKKRDDDSGIFEVTLKIVPRAELRKTFKILRVGE